MTPDFILPARLQDSPERGHYLYGFLKERIHNNINISLNCEVFNYAVSTVSLIQ
jgi:hypothetical protein